jgi:hypothetical protein
MESVARGVLRMVRNRRGKRTMTLLGKFTVLMQWMAPWMVRIILSIKQYDERFEG